VRGGGKHLIEDAGEVLVSGPNDPVVHPKSFAAGGDEARAAKIREMARYLRLASAKAFDEEADTDLVLSHQVQQAETCAVRKRLQETLQPGSFLRLIHMS